MDEQPPGNMTERRDIPSHTHTHTHVHTHTCTSTHTRHLTGKGHMWPAESFSTPLCKEELCGGLISINHACVKSPPTALSGPVS